MGRGTILVTGGAGYIGSHVVLQLRERGESVVVVDDLSRGFRQSVGDTPLVVGRHRRPRTRHPRDARAWRGHGDSLCGVHDRPRIGTRSAQVLRQQCLRHPQPAAMLC